MNTHLNIGKAILHDYFDFYCEQTLDDAEYIPVIKIGSSHICMGTPHMLWRGNYITI